MKLSPPFLAAALTALLVLPVIAAAAPAAGSRSYSASAYALDGGELLYSERHVETWRDGRLVERRVRYEDAEGRLLASKTVDYDLEPAAPSFDMVDHRIGLRESAEVERGRVELFSGPAEGDKRPKSVPLPEDAVIDAGFDAFVRENFPSILSGERLAFDFAVPSAGRFFRFQLVPDGEVEANGRKALLVRMKPASPFLRLLVDPIDLVYARDGRLLEFRGLSNIRDERGDLYKARIVFDYPDAAGPVAAAAASASAP